MSTSCHKVQQLRHETAATGPEEQRKEFIGFNMDFAGSNVP